MAINVKVTITIGTRYGQCAGADYGKIAPEDDIAWAKQWAGNDTAVLTGGATVTSGKGYWKDDSGTMIEEETIIISTATTQDKIHLLRLHVALHWKLYLKQDSVMLTIEPVLDTEFV